MFIVRPFSLPRHPLLRLLLLAAGIALVILLLTFGVLIGAVMLGVAALAALARLLLPQAGRPDATARGGAQARARAGEAGVIEGEYIVLERQPADAEHQRESR